MLAAEHCLFLPSSQGISSKSSVRPSKAPDAVQCYGSPSGLYSAPFVSCGVKWDCRYLFIVCISHGCSPSPRTRSTGFLGGETVFPSQLSNVLKVSFKHNTTNTQHPRPSTCLTMRSSTLFIACRSSRLVTPRTTQRLHESTSTS